MKFNLKKHAGFTILELMLAVAIASVMAAIALPNFSAMIKNNCMTTNANRFVTSLQLARSEAVKRRTNIAIAAKSATSDNEWGTGWRVFVDTNGNGSVSFGEEIIRDVDLTCGIGTTKFDSTVSSITYESKGYLDSAGDVLFTLCDDRTAETGRQIEVTEIGRPSTNNKYACP